MKPLAFILAALMLARWWRRPRPVIAEPWVEAEDGVQPADPRTAALAAAEARGWMTVAEEDIVYQDWLGRPYTSGTVRNFTHWQAEYARHQAVLKP